MASIDEFLSELRTKNTRLTYRASLYAFMDWKYGRQREGQAATPEEMERYGKLIDGYLASNADYAADLRKYAVSMQDIAPLTARARMAAVRAFLEHNDIELSAKDIRKIRAKMPRGGALTVERDLDHEVLKSLLMHSDLKTSALILTLISSGMRIGECLALRIQDINLETDPAIITIRGEHTKSREKRITFVSREATGVLLEWLQRGREKYLQAAKGRNAGLVAKGIGSVKATNDDRVFPFSGHVAQDMWRNAVRNAGLHSVDEATGRGQYHIHQTRKFFRSQLALACPVDIVEALMGHSSYLAAAYRRYTRDQMGEYYRKGEGMITIRVPAKEITRVESEIRKEMEGQQKSITHLVSKNEELERELRGLKGFMEVVSQNPDVLSNVLKKKPLK